MEFKGIYVIIATLIIVAALFVGLAMVDDYSAVDNPYNMKQVDSSLFECEVQDLDYDYAYEYFANKTTVNNNHPLMKEVVLVLLKMVYLEEVTTGRMIMHQQL